MKTSAAVMCPRCGSDLVERNRDGVLIDICPGCRGVWLDRGELEKLVARSGRNHESPDSDRAGHVTLAAPERASGRSPDSDRGVDSDRVPRAKKRWSLGDFFD